MKKVILLALALVFTASISYAQQAAVPKNKAVSPAAVKTVEKKEITGKVKAVTAADPAKGSKSEITVVDERSAEKVLLVRSTTTIYDADFKASGLDKIKADDKVKVKYATTKEGVYEAVSINVLK